MQQAALFYAWSPAIGMNNPDIADPIIVLGPQYDSMTYHVTVSTANGCSAIDDIKVVVLKHSLIYLFLPRSHQTVMGLMMYCAQ
jgi:hypothetical protein